MKSLSKGTQQEKNNNKGKVLSKKKRVSAESEKSTVFLDPDQVELDAALEERNGRSNDPVSDFFLSSSSLNEDDTSE